MSTQIAILIVAIIAIIAGAVLWYKGQKKIVLQALGFLVHKAESYFSAKENQAKIDFVLKKVKSFIPVYLQWLWNDDWVKNKVRIILLQVEKDLGYQSKFDSIVDDTKKNVLEYANKQAQENAKAATDYFAIQLLKSNVDGDYNLVDNQQVKLINEEIKEKLNLGIDLKAFANINTDFKGNGNASAGVEISKKL